MLVRNGQGINDLTLPLHKRKQPPPAPVSQELAHAVPGNGHQNGYTCVSPLTLTICVVLGQAFALSAHQLPSLQNRKKYPGPPDLRSRTRICEKNPSGEGEAVMHPPRDASAQGAGCRREPPTSLLQPAPGYLLL